MKGTTLIKALLAGVLLALTLGAPVQAATPGADCAAYTYVGTGQTLCEDFPGSQDRDCPDVVYRVTVGKSDPWRLDGSGAKRGDGIGCEGNPLYPRPTATPTTTRPTTAPTSTRPPTDPPVEGKPEPSKTSAAAVPQLPKTGPALKVAAGVGLVLLSIGATVFYFSRRRRTHFRA